VKQSLRNRLLRFARNDALYNNSLQKQSMNMQEEFDVPEEQEDDQELYEHYRVNGYKGQELLRIDKFLINRIQIATRTKIQQAA